MRHFVNEPLEDIYYNDDVALLDADIIYDNYDD